MWNRIAIARAAARAALLPMKEHGWVETGGGQWNEWWGMGGESHVVDGRIQSEYVGQCQCVCGLVNIIIIIIDVIYICMTSVISIWLTSLRCTSSQMLSIFHIFCIKSLTGNCFIYFFYIEQWTSFVNVIYICFISSSEHHLWLLSIFVNNNTDVIYSCFISSSEHYHQCYLYLWTSPLMLSIVIILYFKSFTGLTFSPKRFSCLRTAFISERMVITLWCQSRMTKTYTVIYSCLISSSEHHFWLLSIFVNIITDVIYISYILY